MRAFKNLTAVVLALPFLLGGCALFQGGQPNIVETAEAAGQFDTLVDAVRTAGLDDTLESDGPFTIFAPTDAAFAKLPPGTVENLMRPENKAELRKILTYHVVRSRILSADIAGQKIRPSTVQGSKLDIDATKGVLVDKANVVAADVEASNGVIHAIDTVLLPQ